MTHQEFIALAIQRDPSIRQHRVFFGHSCRRGMIEYHSDGRYVSSGICATGETIFYRIPDQIGAALCPTN